MWAGLIVSSAQEGWDTSVARRIRNIPGGPHGSQVRDRPWCFENRRGMPLTIALAAVMGLSQGWVSMTRADGYRLHYTVPRTVAAVDLSTGQEMKRRRSRMATMPRVACWAARAAGGTHSWAAWAVDMDRGPAA